MSTTWKTHYRHWTLSDLLISNLLRSSPLPLSDLTSYCGHKLPSLHAHLNSLKRDGRITRTNEVVLEHPENHRTSQGHPFSPLPDPGSAPPTRPFVEGVATARAHAADALSAPDTPFDRTRAARILQTWITEGSAGKDTPKFIQVWADLVGTSAGAGPPPPTSHHAQHDRLLQCMLACPAPTVRRALSSWESHRHDNPTLPGGPPPGTSEDSPPPASPPEGLLRKSGLPEWANSGDPSPGP